MSLHLALLDLLTEEGDEGGCSDYDAGVGGQRMNVKQPASVYGIRMHILGELITEK